MVFLLRITLPFLLFFIPIAPSYAAGEPLIFSANDTDLRVRETTDFLKQSGALPALSKIQTARVDLNGDGLKEIIVRQVVTGCEAQSNCLYMITGVSARQPVLLASFRARKIGISGEKAYGVKKILVYNHPENDFQSTTYVWTPYTSSFDPQ